MEAEEGCVCCMREKARCAKSGDDDVCNGGGVSRPEMAVAHVNVLGKMG